MTYRYFKYLPSRTIFGKVLHDKRFNIATNPKYDGCKRDFASMVYKFWDKKSPSTYAGTFASSGVKSEIMSNQESAKKLHKPNIRKFEKRKVYSPFKNNILGG